MPGGIGPIDREIARSCRRERPSASLPGGCPESEIFYRLSLGQVFYSYQLEKLYFVSSEHVSVVPLLASALRGLGKTPAIEQRHLDPHRVFPAACRVALSAADAETVLTAFRLSGIGVAVQR